MNWASDSLNGNARHRIVSYVKLSGDAFALDIRCSYADIVRLWGLHLRYLLGWIRIIDGQITASLLLKRLIGRQMRRSNACIWWGSISFSMIDDTTIGNPDDLIVSRHAGLVARWRASNLVFKSLSKVTSQENLAAALIIDEERNIVWRVHACSIARASSLHMTHISLSSVGVPNSNRMHTICSFSYHQ